MIVINNIHIYFQDDLITSGSIQIYPGEITLLTGKSGSGKTTLLNIVSLIDSKSQYSFLLNQKEINQEQYRKQQVSYVFQDYNVIDDLNIKDNFAAMFNLAGKKYNQEEVNQLMDFIDLPVTQLDEKAKSLSGGEKQRLAIALALVKEPSLLVLDEPTASLDEENISHFVSLLDQLKEKNLMIVIATHAPDVFHAEHIYTIKDHQIIENKRNEHALKIDTINGKNNKNRFHYLPYCINHISNHLLINGILLCVSILSLTYILFIFRLEDYSDQYINSMLSTFETNEIIVNNTAGDSESGMYYEPFGMKFTNEEIENIESIENVQQVIPYYSLDISTGFSEIFDFNGQHIMFYNNYDTYLTEMSEVTCNEESYNIYTDSEYPEHFVFSSYDIDSLMNHCIEVDDQVSQGIFISSNLASKLSIEKLDQTYITVNVPILIGIFQTEGMILPDNNGTIYYDEEGNMTQEDGTPLTSVYDYENIYAIEKMTLPVKGIYEEVNSGYEHLFDLYTGERIYLDAKWIEEMHDEIIQNKDIMKRLEDFYLETLDYQDCAYSTDISSSTLIVEAESSKSIDQIMKDIEKNYDYVEFNTASIQKNDMYTNSSINEYKSKIAITLALVSIALLIIQYYTLKRRTKEFAFLKAYGLDHPFIIPCIEWGLLLLVGIPVTFFLLTQAINVLFSLEMNYNSACLIMHTATIIFLFLLISILNYFFVKKIDPAKELRGK